MSTHDREPKQHANQRTLDVEPNPERRQRCAFVLLPPAEGPSVAQILERGPSVHCAQLATDRWIGTLAAQVRQGQVSLEYALLAACIHGEHRGLPPSMLPGALENAEPVGLGQPRKTPLS